MKYSSAPVFFFVCVLESNLLAWVISTCRSDERTVTEQKFVNRLKKKTKEFEFKLDQKLDQNKMSRLQTVSALHENGEIDSQSPSILIWLNT